MLNIKFETKCGDVSLEVGNVGNVFGMEVSAAMSGSCCQLSALCEYVKPDTNLKHYIFRQCPRGEMISIELFVGRCLSAF